MAGASLLGIALSGRSAEDEEAARLNERLLVDAVAEEAAEDIDDLAPTSEYEAPLLGPGAPGAEARASPWGASLGAQPSAASAARSAAKVARSAQKALPALLAAARGRGSDESKAKVKGTCPLCRQAVGSGAHVCASAEWRVLEGVKSEAARVDGNAHFRDGAYGPAIAAYSAALEHNPDDPKLWSNRAAAYTMLGEYQRALEDAEMTIQLAPSWAKGYYRKALLLESRREWAAAAAVYVEVLRNCSRPEEGLAKARRRLPVMTARQRAAEHATRLPPPFCEAAVRSRWSAVSRDASAPRLSDPAELARRLREAMEAKEEGNRAAGESDWEVASERYLRGLALLRFCPERPSEEQARLEAALTLNQALCDIERGRHDEAVERCGQVLALEPTSAKARFRRASALGELQDFDAALEDLDLAIALQPREASLLRLRRLLLERRSALRRREKAQFARMFESG